MDCKNKNRKQQNVYRVFILLLSITLAFVLCVQSKVSRNIYGVYSSADNRADIQVNGVMQKSLLYGNKFVGTINCTLQNTNNTTTFYFDNGGNATVINGKDITVLKTNKLLSCNAKDGCITFNMPQWQSDSYIIPLHIA